MIINIIASPIFITNAIFVSSVAPHGKSSCTILEFIRFVAVCDWHIVDDPLVSITKPDSIN